MSQDEILKHVFGLSKCLIFQINSDFFCLLQSTGNSFEGAFGGYDDVSDPEIMKEIEK